MQGKFHFGQDDSIVGSTTTSICTNRSICVHKARISSRRCFDIKSSPNNKRRQKMTNAAAPKLCDKLMATDRSRIDDDVAEGGGGDSNNPSNIASTWDSVALVSKSCRSSASKTVEKTGGAALAFTPTRQPKKQSPIHQSERPYSLIFLCTRTITSTNE